MTTHDRRMAIAMQKNRLAAFRRVRNLKPKNTDGVPLIVEEKEGGDEKKDQGKK